MKVSAKFALTDTYHFIALFYCFGIVKLPCKCDYWSTEDYMPMHPIAMEFGMMKDCFAFLWRHFHVSTSNNDRDTDLAETDFDGDEDKRVEINLERVQREQMNDENEDNHR